MNAFFGTFLEDAIAGFSNIDVTAGDYTLTVSNPGGTVEEARRAVLVVNGSPGAARNVIIPAVQKLYTVINNTAQPATIKPVGGNGLAIPAGSTQAVWCDGFSVGAVGFPYSTTATLPLGSVAISGQLVLGASEAAPVPLTAYASSGAVAIDLRGRTADNIGILRFMSHDGTVEEARLQSAPGVAGIGLYVGNLGATPVFTADTGGAVTFYRSVGLQQGLAINNGLTVNTGNVSVAAGGLTVAGNGQFYVPGSPTTGAIFLGNQGRGIQFDGGAYQFLGAGAAWHSGNFQPSAYATLAGAGFAGAISAPGINCTAGNLQSAGGLIVGQDGNVNGSLTVGGNLGVPNGVVTCRAPSGGVAGRAMVNSDNRLGAMSVGAGFIGLTIDGANYGINVFASDERMKEDIRDSEEPVLPLLRLLRFIDFRFKRGPEAPPEIVMPTNTGGISAQQARTIKAEWVHESDDEARTLIPNLPLLLTNALKAIVELDGTVQQLRAEMAELRA